MIDAATELLEVLKSGSYPIFLLAFVTGTGGIGLRSYGPPQDLQKIMISVKGVVDSEVKRHFLPASSKSTSWN